MIERNDTSEAQTSAEKKCQYIMSSRCQFESECQIINYKEQLSLSSQKGQRMSERRKKHPYLSLLHVFVLAINRTEYGRSIQELGIVKYPPQEKRAKRNVRLSSAAVRPAVDHNMQRHWNRTGGCVGWEMGVPLSPSSYCLSPS
jgi:hypothetical protein